VSNGSSVLHAENKFQSDSEPNREGMCGERHTFREIPSFHLKDGELFQRIHSRTYQQNIEHKSRQTVLPPDVFFQVIEDPSVKIVEPEPRMVNIIQGEDWQAPCWGCGAEFTREYPMEVLLMRQTFADSIAICIFVCFVGMDNPSVW
jgi:hypothetical protein